MSKNFIDREYIEGLLEGARRDGGAGAGRALEKAGRLEGLGHREAAALLASGDPEHLRRLFSLAGDIKRRVYGSRVVMFAPLYVSDHCVNGCAYCGFSRGNGFERRRLSLDEVREEVRALEKMGHKRLALEAGEHDGECPIEYVVACIRAIYGMKHENGEIRRVNANIAATTEENYRLLKAAGIGTYILFQETYHEPTYRLAHPSGPKSDFGWHLGALDRAQAAGIDDVGGGVLFGLADPHFDVLGLLLHNEHLERECGAGFHTVSVPRLRPAAGAAAGFSRPVGDAEFEKIVAVIRVAAPHAGIILSTRESRDMRRRLLRIGVSQLSAGSSAEVGGYSRRLRGEEARPQFLVNDDRGALSVIEELVDDGYVPSFCTACYRSGRTGDRFMSLAKSGRIGEVCLPNALMTLCEYAMDYGGEAFREKAFALIARELPGVADEAARERAAACVEKIRSGGGRDFYL